MEKKIIKISQPQKKNEGALRYYKWKEFIHPLLLKILASKTTGQLNVDGYFPVDGNYLIVANHACIEDIPTLGQAVREHFYLLVSDEDKDTIDGFGLELNGVEWVHRIDKESRQIASNRAINILQQKKNFAMYPEATWNLSPNSLMLPMNYGCIRMALQANVPIIPVVTFFSENKRYTIIGDKFYPGSDLIKSINQLRDIMATLLYKEMELYQKENYKLDSNIGLKEVDGQEYYYTKRDSLSSNYWDSYVDDKYNKYERARENKEVVREFESQFIFTPKIDDYSFFQEFNSSIRMINGEVKIKRISSESKVYNGINNDTEGYNNFFGYGYNEDVLKKQLKKVL